MSIAIIGDIHGDSRKLQSMLVRLARLRRHNVFVGDYINRGEDSKGVLDLLINFSASNECTFLLGNHELALIRYLRRGDFFEFIKIGGLATLHSYISESSISVHRAFESAFPSAHRRFIGGLSRFFEKPGLLVSHAGFNPLHPERRMVKDMVQGHSDLFSAHITMDRVSVFGHYPQVDRLPYVADDIVCIDTGCGKGGPLCCMLFPERDFIII